MLAFINMDLVIVESPTKAKTLSKFLGKEYEVEASMGHVRDLPKSELGVDVDKDFEPKYVISPKAKKIISALKGKAEKAGELILATDPDREGEAIAWHVLNSISGKTKPSYKRVIFHEITKDAVLSAFKESRKLDEDLIDAQQARRVLDRIVGYKLSPLLWKKIRYGLSAGRVQSVAVRLVVEREDERRNFKPEEYWSLEGIFETGRKERFSAFLFEINGKKVEISSEKEMNGVLSRLNEFQNDSFYIFSVEKTEKKRNPYPPFTTSTLQQAAVSRFGFTAKRTMSAAQKLFEQGYITYHRTDSLNLSGSFLNHARDFISKEYGAPYLPVKPNFYKTRQRNAQEAHEAIRPTNPGLLSLKEADINADEKKLYRIIWQRALSSQMTPAVFDQVTVIVNSGDNNFRFKSVDSKIKFDGWQKVYKSIDEDDASKEEGSLLPDLKEAEKVIAAEFKPQQHFTEPKPRYTEASLIKALEEKGIGRPSTYAPTITTILDRGYVAKDGKNLYPLDLGFVVTKLLVSHFPEVVDYNFTKAVEESLDEIAEGKLKWVKVIKDFYDPFIKDVESKDLILNKKDFTVLEETEEKCPLCGSSLVIKLGKFGRFKSCSNFPDCKYAQTLGNGEILSDGATITLDETQLGKCPECKEGDLKFKDGRFGKFIACSNYPTCKFTKPYLDKIGMKCPLCKEGDIVIKKGGRFKKIFYGCSNYPKCKYVSGTDPRQKKEEQGDI